MKRPAESTIAVDVALRVKHPATSPRIAATPRATVARGDSLWKLLCMLCTPAGVRESLTAMKSPASAEAAVRSVLVQTLARLATVARCFAAERQASITPRGGRASSRMSCTTEHPHPLASSPRSPRPSSSSRVAHSPRYPTTTVPSALARFILTRVLVAMGVSPSCVACTMRMRPWTMTFTWPRPAPLGGTVA